MKDLIERQKSFFDTNQTKSIPFRIEQLRKLKKLLIENEQRLNRAIHDDFRKSAFDNYTCEIAIIYSEIDQAIKNIKHWAKWKRVKTNLLNFPAKSYIIPEPFGVSLVIGAWNYPYQLSMVPAVAAIAAGNTVILKPSEIPVKTSNIMAEIVNANFNPAFFKVVEGGVAETQKLLNQKFDKIFFTGSIPVGRIVYQAAAKNLTPVTLELGGKSPAFILDDKNMEMYVKRLVWAKFLNAGQTCIAPDYVVLAHSLKKRFLELAIKEIKKEQFSINNQNYVQIINDSNMKRISSLIDKEKVVWGGSIDLQNRTIEPTIMENVTFEDPVMQEEIFGPIFPIIAYESLDEIINIIKQKEKPLACYVFTSNSEMKNRILKEISFGGGAVNDAVMHIGNGNLPFGGVGESGTGSYHGEYGFRTFSHFKSILEKPVWFESDAKYFPHTTFKMQFLKLLFRLS
jgi:aldehyde dehydrogenase (NAD+)